MKRSLSHSSRSSNSRRISNKNSTSNDQKELGATWGANASRPSFRSSPFSDFGSYMDEKNRKLQNQYNAEASCSTVNGAGLKQIFYGVSIFVDGFTIPSSQELRGYMLRYGGRLENYFSRRRVSHIICSNLPDSKKKNLRAFSRGLPVVKPNWILDSVVANRLLDCAPYLLDQPGSDQPKLLSFFAPKTSFISGAINTGESVQPNLEPSYNVEDVSESSGQRKNTNLIRLTFHRDDNSECSHSCDVNSKESLVNSVNNDEIKDIQNIDVAKQCDTKFMPSPVGKHCSSDQKAENSIDLNGAEHFRPRLSTSEDPNFVESYFKSSRLHFIGTWKKRYRKRFPCQLVESNLEASSSDHGFHDRKASIVHIDLDCFFVSVVTRKYPEMRDQPVAVCHSDNKMGTAEISSANYPARKYGIKAGMFVRDAKALYPELIIVPYNFNAYEEVSDQFYQILHKHCNKVQAVSCDEAFLDASFSEESNAETLASIMRKEIFETTGCTASAGISINMLMARLATKSAKPDGQIIIPADKVDEYLENLPVKDLPGVGYVLAEKMKKQNILTCGHLLAKSKESLQRDFGRKTGEMLWNYSKGVDSRLVGVPQETKSVGAEVNWGVRFKELKDCHQFIQNLCKEVALRLHGCGVVGRNFTLKIKKRRKDAEEPVKFLGCGSCENLSHSITVPTATDDIDMIDKISKSLFRCFNIDVQEIRGVGLQVSKLELAEHSKQEGTRSSSLKSWLTSSRASDVPGDGSCVSAGTSRSDPYWDELPPDLQIHSHDRKCNTWNDLSACNSRQSDSVSIPPPMCDLDIEVIENLPPEVFSELNDSYGGKLADYVLKLKETRENESDSTYLLHKKVEGSSSSLQSPSRLTYEKQRGDQVDTTRSELTEVYGTPSHSCFISDELWKENSHVMFRFRESNNLVLKKLTEIYTSLGHNARLSHVLQELTLSFPHALDESDCEWRAEDGSILCDFLMVYIKVVAPLDIEEINASFLLLRRLSSRSKAISHAYEALLPFLQTCIADSYGGILQFHRQRWYL